MISKMNTINNKKIKKGSNGMEPSNLLTPNYISFNWLKYLNVSMTYTVLGWRNGQRNLLTPSALMGLWVQFPLLAQKINYFRIIN